MTGYSGPVHSLQAEHDITDCYSAQRRLERHRLARDCREDERREFWQLVKLAVLTVVAIYGGMWLVAWGMAAYR